MAAPRHSARCSGSCSDRRPGHFSGPAIMIRGRPCFARTARTRPDPDPAIPRKAGAAGRCGFLAAWRLGLAVLSEALVQVGIADHVGKAVETAFTGDVLGH